MADTTTTPLGTPRPASERLADTHAFVQRQADKAGQLDGAGAFAVDVEIAKLAALERIEARLEALVPPSILLAPPTVETAAAVVVDGTRWTREDIDAAKSSGVPSAQLKAEADELRAKVLEHVRRRGLDPARATVQLEQSPADGGWFLKISGPRFDEDGKF